MCWFGSPSSRISVLWNLTVGIECGNMGSENGSYPKLGVYFSIGVPQTTGFPIRKITHFGWLWGPTLPAQCLQADLRGKVDPEVDFVGGSGFLIKGWGILSFFFGNMGTYLENFYFGDGAEFRIFEQQTWWSWWSSRECEEKTNEHVDLTKQS